MNLKDKIEQILTKSDFGDADRAVFEEFKAALRTGAIRSAEPGDDGEWRTNAWV